MNVRFEAWGTWNEVEIYDTKSSQLISLSLGDQITTTLATSVLPIYSEENS